MQSVDTKRKSATTTRSLLRATISSGATIIKDWLYDFLFPPRRQAFGGFYAKMNEFGDPVEAMHGQLVEIDLRRSCLRNLEVKIPLVMSATTYGFFCVFDETGQVVYRQPFGFKEQYFQAGDSVTLQGDLLPLGQLLK